MMLWQELRRRRVFRVMALYIVGAWLVLQVAATLFPAWGIPDEGLRYLFIAAVVGFPVAVIFGWFFDVTAAGIVRTPAAHESEGSDYRLKRTDYAILAALIVVALAVVYGSLEKVVETTSEETAAREKAPNSVAVIPFVNLDDESDSDYFSDGVTEEILHRLSEFKNIHVLGHASSFAFKASDLPTPRISDILGVRYLLSGSIRREADQVRVRASLVDDSGVQVWSAAFDREVQGIFALQSEIANTVAREMVVEIAPRDTRPGRATESAEAYDQYLFGREYLRSRVPRYTERAEESFRRAIGLDDGFAPAHAGLAMAVALRAGNNLGDFGDRIDEAQSHVDRALQLVPDLAEGHAAQGLILEFGQQADFVAAEDALRRAIELDPTLMNAYNWLSIALGSQRRIREAREVFETALEHDPLNPIINANAANRYAFSGDFHGAERRFLRLIDLPQPPGTVYMSLAGLYDSYGRFPKSIEWGKKRVIAYSGDTSAWSLSTLGNTYLHLGMNAAADYWIDKSIEIDPHPINSFFRRNYRLKVHGRYEEMGRMLEQVVEENLIDVSRVTVFAAEIISAIYMLTGNHESGIPLMERIIDPDKPLTNVGGGSVTMIDFMHMLVYSYRQVGRHEDAEVLLEKCRQHLDYLRDEHDAASPGYLETRTLHHAMRGEMETAVRTFEQAVDTGWRNYHFIKHDPRWQEFFALPAVQSQLAFVRADLDRQRKLVEAMNAERDFRVIFEQKLPDR